MPIYAYRCLQCEAEPEYIQKMSDEPMAVCEACSGVLVRQVTAAAFHLKGGGWYKDGYASTKPGESASKGGESKPAPASDGASKPDSASKPAESSTTTTTTPTKAAPS